jgi:2-C-methyl-D-erythritol 2,4-cyclodiphosphate synthase
MLNSIWSKLFLLSATALAANAFGIEQARQRRAGRLFSSAATDADSLLKPSYEIEPLQVRIGHGFDIHRMVPIEEAGQPVVIAGVEVTHTDQKVSRKTGKRQYMSNGGLPYPLFHVQYLLNCL